MPDIEAWLAALDLAKYAETFAAHEIDTAALRYLTEDDLKTLGLPLGPRRKLLGALSALPQETAAQPAPVVRRDVAERRQLTVLFVDLVGSTALASRLDPEMMRDVLRSYQNTVTGEIARVQGHVAKLMGDGVLAYFGWPRAHEDEAERAVRAGLALAAAVARLASPTGAALACRVGIATGQVVVGDLIGEGAAQEAAVVGETPNLAARLQEVAGPGEVVIAAATRRLLGGGFVLDDLGARTLKGLERPQPAFRVTGERTVESRYAARADATLTPLVGRDEELALLLRAWRQAVAGEGQAVLLIGEAGIGKSRLLRSLHDAVEGEAATALLYQCSPFFGDSPLWPVLQQLALSAGLAAEDEAAERHAKLATRLRMADEDPPAAAMLVAQLLGASVGADPFADLSSDARRSRTLQALIDDILAQARSSPVLCCLEDAHWIDPSTFELLQRMIGAIDTARVLVVVTARPDNEPALGPAPHFSRLPLGRLARTAASALVGEVIAARVLPESVKREILARSDGVPLYIEELTKAVLEAGPDGHGAVPASLQDSLLARLDRAPAMKAVAQIAACIGREFDHLLLQSVSDLPLEELAQGLQALVAAELVFRRGTPPEASYSFKHALVRDVAYQSQLTTRRRQVHERIAQTLESGGTTTMPELLAVHWSAAGRIPRAVDCWLSAGRLAAQRSANLEAAEHFSKGLELLRHHPDAEGAADRQLSLLIALGPALMATRGWSAEEVDQTYMQAAELAAGAGRSVELFPALWGRWLGAHGGGRAALALSLLDELLDLARGSDDKDVQLQAHHAGTSNMLTEGRLAEATRHADAAMALYQPGAHREQALIYGGHDPAVCIQCINALGHLMQGDLARSREISDRMLALAPTIGHMPTVAHAHSYRAELCQIHGDVAQTELHARAVLAIAQPLGMSHYVAWATMALGWCLARRGERKPALSYTAEGLSMLNASKNLYHLPHRLTQRAEAFAACGEMRQAAEAFDEAEASVGQTGERWFEAEVLRKKAEFLMAASPSNAGLAEDLLVRAIAVTKQQGARFWELRAATALAELWAARSAAGKARQAIEPICASFDAGLEHPDLRRARSVLERLGRA